MRRSAGILRALASALARIPSLTSAGGALGTSSNRWRRARSSWGEIILAPADGTALAGVAEIGLWVGILPACDSVVAGLAAGGAAGAGGRGGFGPLLVVLARVGRIAKDLPDVFLLLLLRHGPGKQPALHFRPLGPFPKFFEHRLINFELLALAALTFEAQARGDV